MIIWNKKKLALFFKLTWNDNVKIRLKCVCTLFDSKKNIAINYAIVQSMHQGSLVFCAKIKLPVSNLWNCAHSSSQEKNELLCVFKYSTSRLEKKEENYDDFFILNNLLNLSKKTEILHIHTDTFFHIFKKSSKITKIFLSIS
jgi:hypothetical protein